MMIKSFCLCTLLGLAFTSQVVKQSEMKDLGSSVEVKETHQGEAGVNHFQYKHEKKSPGFFSSSHVYYEETPDNPDHIKEVIKDTVKSKEHAEKLVQMVHE